MNKAKFRRFWHCLFRLHRAIDSYELWGHANAELVAVWCECGKIFWERKTDA